METLLTLPGPAVARVLRTTAEKGPMSKIYCTTIRGRPALVSSNGLNMTLNFLPGEPLGRDYVLTMFGGVTSGPTRLLLENPQAVLTLEYSSGRTTWRVHAPNKVAAFTLGKNESCRFFEDMCALVLDFEAVIRSASLSQIAGFELLMSPQTAKLIADANLGDARIYGTGYPWTSAYCICFPSNPDVFLFAMASEWSDMKDEYWSIP